MCMAAAATIGAKVIHPAGMQDSVHALFLATECATLAITSCSSLQITVIFGKVPCRSPATVCCNTSSIHHLLFITFKPQQHQLHRAANEVWKQCE